MRKKRNPRTPRMVANDPGTYCKGTKVGMYHFNYPCKGGPAARKFRRSSEA